MSEGQKPDQPKTARIVDLEKTIVAGAPLPREELVGDTIGRFKLLEKLGEGGFGTVYVAEQKEPVRRRVALKITKLGMDTRQVIARFEAERQALAMMDHPNIARVLDAGATETGRPFFVMELVRGVKITEFCDEHKLPTHKRLDLFIQVCRAIEHAHQKGIIHRDIKPSNILVTLHDGVPVPKVIDFGIAKATQGSLTDKTVYTQFDQFVGTPTYMSPEQAELSGLDIDTRTDIYSLGVLLYELLTSQTPFEGKNLIERGFDEMRRMIRETEPLRPSVRLNNQKAQERTTTANRHGTDAPRLIKMVSGDLDWVVMKCLEKDRTRRYETAGALALDVQRFLNHEAVEARPPSKLYRTKKFVRRNRLAFAAGSVVLLSLVGALAVTSWFMVEERDERDQAQSAFRSADVNRRIAENERDQAKAANIQAEASRRKAEMALAQSEIDRHQAEAAQKEAEAARRQAELALQQSRADRNKAAAADQEAKTSQSQAFSAQKQAEVALKEAADAQNRALADAAKIEAASNFVATEAALREKAQVQAKTALAEVDVLQGAISNVMNRLAMLPPAEALKESSLLFAPGDEKQPWAPQFLAQRAEWHARLGQWKDAASDVAEVLEMQPNQAEAYHDLALLLAQTSQWDAYGRHRSLLLNHFAATTNRDEAQLAAGAALLATNTNNDFTNAIALARVSGDPLNLALAEYRQDDFPAAAADAGRVSDANVLRCAQAAAVLALAQAHLRQTNDASIALNRAVTAVQTAQPKVNSGDYGPDWRNWIAAVLLTKEAGGYLNPGRN